MSRLLLPAAFVAFLGAPALAADPLAAAWEAASLGRDGSIAEREAARLNVVAYHAAVASLCEGFSLDEAEVAEQTAAILGEHPGDASEAERLQLQVDALIGLGTAKGLFLAEGALNPEAFCAGAERTRDLPDFDDLWADR